MIPTDRSRAMLRPIAGATLALVLAACATTPAHTPTADGRGTHGSSHAPARRPQASPADPVDLLEARAREALAAGDALGAAHARALLDRELQGAARDRNRDELLAALAGVDVVQLRDHVERLAREDPLRPWLEQALREQGQVLPRELPQPSRQVDTLAPGDEPGAPGQHALRQVAVLLPQSSAVASVAQSIRDGLLAAYFASPPAQRPRLRIYDSGSTPQEAIAAYHQAVADGAERVIGPLLREAVGALFHEPLSVPLLALNHPDTGEVPTPGSAEYGLLPEAEGAQVAERMLQRGLTQVAIFHADADWAARAAAAFRAQFEAGGGSVAGLAQLADKDINHAAAIRQATATLEPTAAAGVFVSLRPQQARLLVAQLRAARIAAPVFATSHVYAGNANATLDRDLNGVEFCDAPWLFGPIAGRPDRSEVSRYVDSANGAGGRLFAFGMDAWALLPYIDWLIDQPGAYLNGATGQLTADRFGRVHRLVGWAVFVDGLPVPVTGALEASPVTSP